MRTSKQEDITRVTELMNICFKDEIELGMELPTPSDIASRIEKGEIILLVEEENSKLIAFALIQTETTAHPAEIHMLGVDPGYHRNGIGTRLMEACIDLARKHDWKKVKLYTRPWNLPMRKLVARFEFIPEGYLRKEHLDKDVILYSFFR
ncbi:MAG: GNAT family N-acetyltransferase [Promethearchaeota archaeon]